MQTSLILRILGILLMLFSFTMLPSALLSVWFGEHAWSGFVIAFAITLLTGFTLWYPGRHVRGELKTKDGFLVTVLFWTVLGCFGSIPLLLAPEVDLSATEAIFESISGLTTTGATVIVGIDALPRSILFYRQQLQWLGGMGIIVLALAILPMLGIGGMQLYRAETPGPVKDTKLTPRLTETAKALWLIYFGLTLACALGYWVAGMDAFDAICHSFATVAIGGFSTHDASLGHFQNDAVYWVAAFFMVISGANFALHFHAWRRREARHYWQDPEFRFYLAIIGAIAAVTVLLLMIERRYDDTGALVHGVVNTVSIVPTTGFTTEPFSEWPSVLPYLLMFGAVVGGCAGSTAGGMKVIRALLILKQGHRELKRLIHPQGVFLVKLGRQPVADRIVEAVWGFGAVYMLVFAALLMGLLTLGHDFTTAFSTVVACLNNLGPGLGEVATSYRTLDDSALWIAIGAMLLGRLEIFTLLVLFTPMFWRR